MDMEVYHSWQECSDKIYDHTPNSEVNLYTVQNVLRCFPFCFNLLLSLLLGMFWNRQMLTALFTTPMIISCVQDVVITIFMFTI